MIEDEYDDWNEELKVSVGVDSMEGNPSKQTTAGGVLSEPLPTGAYQGKSDNRSIGGVEQSGVKGAKRPEMNGYGAHSQDRGPTAKRLDMTESEPTLTPAFEKTFWMKVDKSTSDGCWIWKGGTIDHLCRVHLCVNPSHLEQVTPYENTMRGEGVAVKNSRKTHCPRGHPYEGDNLLRSQLRYGARACKTCKRESSLAKAKAAREHDDFDEDPDGESVNESEGYNRGDD